MLTVSQNQRVVGGSTKFLHSIHNLIGHCKFCFCHTSNFFVTMNCYTSIGNVGQSASKFNDIFSISDIPMLIANSTHTISLQVFPVHQLSCLLFHFSRRAWVSSVTSNIGSCIYFFKNLIKYLGKVRNVIFEHLISKYLGLQVVTSL